MSQIETNKKIKANAVSAYLLIFVSIFFLTNRNNSLLNNDFVKTHTKSAFLIHLGFLATYIVFEGFSVGGTINIAGIYLNTILTSWFFTALLGLLLFWIYKANKWEKLTLIDVVSSKSNKKLLDINTDQNIDERDKLTFLLSYVPFVGFYNYATVKDNIIAQEATKLNLFVTIIGLLLFIFNYGNILSLLVLVYITGVVFIGINAFAKNEFITIKLPDVFSPAKKYFLTQWIIKYLTDYYKKETLNTLDNYAKYFEEKYYKAEASNNAQIEQLRYAHMHRKCAYVPLLNYLFLFQKPTQYYFHVVNGVTLGTYMILILLLSLFGLTPFSFILLLLVPVMFWIGQMQVNKAYQMPYVYWIYVSIKKIFLKWKEFNKKYNKTEKINLTVEKK